MYRVHRHYVPKIYVFLFVLELGVLVLSVYLGAFLRFGENSEVAWVSYGELFIRAILFAVVVMICIIGMGLYQRHMRADKKELVWRVCVSFLLGSLFLMFIYYLFPGLLIGRGVFMFALLISLSSIVFIRIMTIDFVSENGGTSTVLVLGAGKNATVIETQLRRKTDRLGLNIVGYVPVGGESPHVSEERLIREKTNLLSLAQLYQVDEIIVAVDERRDMLPVKELLDCKMSGYEVVDQLAFFERQSGKVMLEMLTPGWLVFSDGFRFGQIRSYSKRIFDIVVSLLVLGITWPVMLLVACAIKLDDRGPVIYQQVRVGCNWRLISVLKFRSMRVDAEKGGEARWAAADDDRITRVGRIIRKLRIDELPQIFNVLKGEMSFVGPRPERPKFVDQFSENIPYYGERHCVKPGITGWAQISYPYGDSEKDAREKLQYDLYYVKNYGLLFDLMIIVQTVAAVLWSKGGR